MKRRSGFVALMAMLAGCAASPVPNTYVLNEPPEGSTGAIAAAAGAQILRLERVLVPGYLDTTDIQWRVGSHRLQSSSTGRWGERLSAGITHALRADLAARLPALNVVQGAENAPSALQVRIDVDDFDVWLDGHCLLIANWAILAHGGKAVLLSGRGTFAAPSMPNSSPGDAAIVGGMSAALAELAARVAEAVTQFAATKPDMQGGRNDEPRGTGAQGSSGL
jgi:uncharacterized lipoprotein YmbA